MKIVRISAIWCTSCIITNKDYQTLKENHPDFEYIDLDYDTDDIDKYNPGNILPIIIMYKNDQEVGRIIGEKKYKDIEEKISEVM